MTSIHYSKLAVIKMTAAESVEEYVYRGDNHLSIQQAAQFKLDMEVIVRAVINGLHPHFIPMVAPLLLSDLIKTLTHVRDGFEALDIVGNVPRQIEYGNAANGMSIEIENAFKNYDCHLCGHLGHISRNYPSPPTHPPLPGTNERSYGRGNQRGRGY